jgi:primosomal protein N' (replication factor Y)
LEKGWHLFWEAELSERKELSLPPWQFLVEIHAGNQIKDETLSILERAGFECLDPEPGGDLIWVRSKRTEPLRKALEPLFSVSRSRQGFPRVKVWID